VDPKITEPIMPTLAGIVNLDAGFLQAAEMPWNQ
jgi:hypothetical protein